MDLRQMRYFVAVAEEGSFSKAATRLHMSQPPLSQQIKGVEDELGAQLFHRLPRGVTLTPAGSALLVSSRSILAQVRAATNETTQIAAGMSGTLRMGTVGSALFNVLPKIFDHLSRAMPDIRIELTELSSREQVQSLMRDEIDVAILHTPIDTSELKTKAVYSEPFCAVLPKNHRLAGDSRLDLKALASEEFVFFHRHLASGLFDRMIAACMQAGFSPRIHHFARHQVTILQMVAMGMGVTLLPRSIPHTSNDNVVFHSLDSTNMKIELAMAWKSEASAIGERVAHELDNVQ